MNKQAHARDNELCQYWYMAGFYNHGGALPCQRCVACKEQAESIARVTKWNADTQAGADPRR